MWDDVEVVSVAEDDLWVSIPVSGPSFSKGEGKVIEIEVMHKFKLRECDKFI